MEGMGGSLILIQIRETDFSNPYREDRVPFHNRGREGGNPSPQEYQMKVDIPSFSNSLDIESFLNWIYEVDNFFDMTYIPLEKQVKFVAFKLKKDATA